MTSFRAARLASFLSLAILVPAFSNYWLAGARHGSMAETRSASIRATATATPKRPDPQTTTDGPISITATDAGKSQPIRELPPPNRDQNTRSIEINPMNSPTVSPAKPNSTAHKQKSPPKPKKKAHRRNHVRS